MIETSAAAVELFRSELALCGVRPGETIAVLAREGAREGRAEGFLAAVRSLGADGYIVAVPAIERRVGSTGRSALARMPEVLELLTKADMVVDLVMLLFSREQAAMQRAGCRVLSCVEPFPILERLLPDEALRQRVEQAAERLGAARELRIASAAGTDVSYRLGDYPVLAQYGYTDTAGRWDHWPSALVATHGADDGVDGVIVLSTGDLLLFPVPCMVREQVTLSVEAGFVTAIEGSGIEAMQMREFFEAAQDDPDARGLSHVGWGLHPRAEWALHGIPGSRYMDSRSYEGNVMVSTGPNTELGGTRDTPFHLDIPMRDCSLFLDGDEVVAKGQLVSTS